MPRPGAASAITRIVPGNVPRTLEPPAPMGVRERKEWNAIVDRLGVEHFPREVQPLLMAYCACAIQLNDLNEKMASFPPGLPKDEAGLAEYVLITKLRASVGGQLASFATKLRISNQGRFPKTGSARQLPDAELPWRDQRPVSWRTKAKTKRANEDAGTAGNADPPPWTTTQ